MFAEPLRAVAVTGRRIDAEDAHVQRFPLTRVPVVRERISQLLGERRPAWLVSSAACGADLIAQVVAGELGVGRRVVLPYDPATFRASSVVDRPGDWGRVFDRLMSELTPQGNVVDLHLDPKGPAVYQLTNDRILEETLRLADGHIGECLAIVVWDGKSRGDDDYTAAFANAAAKLGMQVGVVLTIS